MGGVRELEPFEHLLRAFPGLGSREVVQPADHLQVLQAGEVLIDGRELPREADHGAQPHRVPHDIEACHGGRALVRLEEGGEDADGGRLARPIRPEQPEDRALLHGHVHPLTARTFPKDLVRPSVVMIAFAMRARISTLDDTDMSAGRPLGSGAIV